MLSNCSIFEKSRRGKKNVLMTGPIPALGNTRTPGIITPPPPPCPGPGLCPRSPTIKGRAHGGGGGGGGGTDVWKAGEIAIGGRA